MKSKSLATVETAGMTFCHPTQEEVFALTAEALHPVLLNSLHGYLANGLTAKHAVQAAKLKMQAGEAVGGCETFTSEGGYVDRYLRDKEGGETLSTANRYFYRLLEGVGVDAKYDSSEAKARRKEAAAAKAEAIEKRSVDREAAKKLQAVQDKADEKRHKKNAKIVETSLDDIVAFILKNVTADGCASPAAMKRLYDLAAAVHLRVAA